MIYADLNGKSHVPEDVLTSNCLGLLNLLPKCDFLSFLALARNSSGAPLRIAMSSTADLSLDFWPYLRDGGIPDAVVTVEMSGAERFKVFIEAKHGASQSGNQIASYLRAAYRCYGDRCALIYLTHHRSFPKEECEESERQADVPAKIHWICWHDLFLWANDQLSTGPCRPYSEIRILESIAYYLAEKGYRKFIGWGQPPAAHITKFYGRVYIRAGSASAATYGEHVATLQSTTELLRYGHSYPVHEVASVLQPPYTRT